VSELMQVDPKTASDELLNAMWDTYSLLYEESHPGEPMTPLAQQVADWRSEGSDVRRLVRWIVRDGEAVVAVAVVFMDMEQNLENGFARVAVHPGHRGKGYARMLAGPVFDTLEKEGRTRLDTWVVADSPFVSLPERLGLKAVYTSRESRLNIADLDMELMDSWIDRARERASEYELVFYETPLPDDVLAKYCDLVAVMNTAPREDYQADDEVMTPENWRKIEDEVAGSQGHLNICIAVHKPTGEFAGYTSIKTQDLEPEAAGQWDTGVYSDHRNKGLGRWLKAANIKSVLERYPRVERITTDNAGSNEPMLAINIEMGFQPLQTTQAWQGDLAPARKAFGA